MTAQRWRRGPLDTEGIRYGDGPGGPRPLALRDQCYLVSAHAPSGLLPVKRPWIHRAKANSVGFPIVQ